MLLIPKAEVKVASDLPELMLYKKEQGKCYTRKKNMLRKTVNKANRKIFFSASMVFIWICFLYPGIIWDIYGNIQKQQDIYSAHIYPSTAVTSLFFHVLLALRDLGDLSILFVCLPYHLSMCVLSTESNKWTQKPNSFTLPAFGHVFFQHHLAKYLPYAITELTPTLQGSYVEARIPIFIAFGLKSLCRSN